MDGLDCSGLCAADLVKSFGGRRVVDGASLSVARGEIVGILGPNGAGKTTTFYMLVGLEHPDSGRISIGGLISPLRRCGSARVAGLAT